MVTIIMVIILSWSSVIIYMAVVNYQGYHGRQLLCTSSSRIIKVIIVVNFCVHDHRQLPRLSRSSVIMYIVFVNSYYQYHCGKSGGQRHSTGHVLLFVTGRVYRLPTKVVNVSPLAVCIGYECKKDHAS